MIYAGILAGGIGSRMNISNMPKQFLNIGDKPIIIHTIEKFLLCNKIDKIYVGVNPDWNAYLVDIIEKDYNYLVDKIVIVDGGKDRNSTILNVISAINNDNKITDDDILITHDAVRPFVSIKMIEENIENCKKYNIVDTVVPAFDTIVTSEDGEFISSIPDRKTMFQGQTPQTFKINKFMEYYSKLTEEEKNILTDACKIFVLNGEKVFLVNGDFSNIKITTVTDLKIAKAMLMEN
ncbi:IspD/TarI family cytidylyltransferase [Parvimonas parva]|uniref:Ribitol-5-phosphate cytidylyltransferase n=1 Tax=Parvimonas parva TaxID=2769485 RepID=A0ABS1C8H0_9FIRM|nr:2-C-methyl-D-erythritol 4-phosphate cytidylyltransferase [Parvimonas parva]MBK1468402.1 2-C-methyl-D-erythritol 4-phosphate cytidylyltransferase [Parvimonas parva]